MFLKQIAQPGNEFPEMKRKKYHSVVYSLLWLARTTIPELSYYVSELIKYTANPGTKHWDGMIRLLQYVKSTINYGIEFKKRKVDKGDTNSRGEFNITTYVDASYANGAGAKSKTGFIVFVNGAPIIWKSITQKVVAQSTAEAEYIVACDAAKDVLYLRNLIN